MPFHRTGTVWKFGEVGVSSVSADETPRDMFAVVSMRGLLEEEEVVLGVRLLVLLFSLREDSPRATEAEGSLPARVRSLLILRAAVGRDRGPAGRPGRSCVRGMASVVLGMAGGCDEDEDAWAS